MSEQARPAQRTPLHGVHVRLGAKLVEFAGFEMPVLYTSIVAEHTAVRERAGLFDVSHMGQIHLAGARAVETAERLLTCPVASLAVGRVRYGMLCNERGGVVDDVTVYRLAPDEVMLCVNAANIEKDDGWIRAQAAGVEVRNHSDATGLLALQGPAAPALIKRLAGAEATAIRRFRFARLPIGGVRVLVSNTGYTGSPGYELYLAAEHASALFERLLSEGRDLGIVPAGLGARDTLRLEAALPLYGHELDDETSPLAAGLGRFVKRGVGGFIGAEAIEARSAAGHPLVLVGFELTDRGVARAGHAISCDEGPVGRVTSGGHSPTLGRSIGMGYVPPTSSAPGVLLAIEVRGRKLAARVVETPFVRPGRADRGVA
jgi:aminomethyltransferase